MFTSGKAAVLCALLLVAHSSPPAQATHVSGRAHATTERPNIVVFYVDDVAPHDGRLWSSPSRTPSVYRHFVASGTSFPNAIGETPLCCPGRAGLFTGLHTHNHGVTDNDARLFDPTVHVAKRLRGSGYTTMLLGKYFNRASLLTSSDWLRHSSGWDHMDVFRGGNGCCYMDYSLFTKSGTLSMRDYHSTQMVADRAVMRLRAAPPDKPVFAVLAPYNLHAPNVPMPRFANSPLCSGMDPWKPPNYNEADVSDKPAYVRAQPLLSNRAGWSMVRYCEEMLGIDWLVGQVTAELDAQGRLENTLLVFTGDNGMAWGAHRFGQEKAIPYATPVPLYMTWPARWGTNARSIDEHVANIDLAPTFCEIGGCTLDAYPGGQTGPDGVSIMPLLDEEVSRLDRTALLEAHLFGPEQWTAVRTTRHHPAGLWHYVEHTTGERELYDLEADPWELENIAAAPRVAGVVSALAADLAELRQEGRATGGPSGTIRVILDALPNHSRDFAFDGSLGPFVLDDDADATRPRLRTFTGLAPGTYSVTQGKVTGWSLVGLSCTPTEITDRATLTATVTLDAGDFVVCTFTDALRRPDGSIAKSQTGTYRGGNIYSATPLAEQTQKRTGVLRGSTYRYWIRIQNDSARQDRFVIRGEPSGTGRMTVRYLVGGIDVSAAVTAGTFTTGAMAAGATTTLVVEITVGANALVGDQKVVLVRLTSVSEPSRVDVVRAIAIR